MSSTTTTEQQIVDALRAVPSERWEDVLRFVTSLQAQIAPDPPIRTAHDLLLSGMVGVWGDRSDLGDRQAFARRLRDQAERRGDSKNAPGH